MAQKIVSTASDQQSLGEPVLPLVTHTVPHEMMSSTLTSQINNLTSQLGNLNIPKAASMQIQEPVDVKKCTGFTQHVLPVTTSAQSTGNRSFANELCREASAGQHHNAFRSLDHSKQSTAVNTQVRASNRHHEHLAVFAVSNHQVKLKETIYNCRML